DTVGMLAAENEMDRLVENGPLNGVQLVLWVPHAVKHQCFGHNEHIGVVQQGSLNEADTGLGDGIGSQQAEIDAAVVKLVDDFGWSAFLEVKIKFRKALLHDADGGGQQPAHDRVDARQPQGQPPSAAELG